MKYEINREETTMKTGYETNARAEKKSGRRMSGFALAALLVFGFAVPAHSLPPGLAGIGSRALSGFEIDSEGYRHTHDMGITLATINVPVKLHHMPEFIMYSVACEVYDRHHGRLRRVGDGEHFKLAPIDVDITLPVTIHPLKSVSDRGALTTWMCHLKVKDSRNVASLRKPGTRLRKDVSGTFTSMVGNTNQIRNTNRIGNTNGGFNIQVNH